MDTGSLPLRWDSYARRLPSSLEDLRGPAAGVIELPLHVAWSGRRVYDVGREAQRLVLYALLLAEAPREDLQRFVHRESLVSIWPRLRRLLGRTPAGSGSGSSSRRLPGEPGRTSSCPFAGPA